MRYKVFFVSAQWPEAAEQQLNQFLDRHTIVSVDREFSSDNGVTGWNFCVGWLAAPDKSSNSEQRQRDAVDYREKLNAQDFSVFSELRVLRKQIAQEVERPVYAVFSNEQLAEMVTRRVRSADAMREIAGIGDSRIKQFSASFLQLLVSLQAEEA